MPVRREGFRSGFARGNGVEITVPKGLLELESMIRVNRRQFVKACADEIRDDARSRIEPSRHIGPSLRVRVVGAEAAELYSNHPGAKAQDRGAYIEPKPGGLLVFTNRKTGDRVFTRKPIRIKAKHFIGYALAPRNKRASIERAFNRIYGPKLAALGKGQTVKL